MQTMTVGQLHDVIGRAVARSRTQRGHCPLRCGGLVAAELNHRLRRALAYCAQARSDRSTVSPSRRRRDAVGRAVDTAHGFAYPALDLAIDWHADAARRQDIAIAELRRAIAALSAYWSSAWWKPG